jgi:hypothetical protein
MFTVRRQTTRGTSVRILTRGAPLAVLLGMALSPPAAGAVVYETEDPFGGLFGVYGFDVNTEQSVAIRFTPAADYTLDEIRLWLWNNDRSGEATPITITLRNDGPASLGGASVPGEARFESWSFEIPYTGFAEPQLFEFPSGARPVLRAGTNYWIVAESAAHGPLDPVWAVAQPGTGFGAIRNRNDPWHSGPGSVGATIILGTLRPVIGAD